MYPWSQKERHNPCDSDPLNSRRSPILPIPSQRSSPGDKQRLSVLARDISEREGKEPTTLGLENALLKRQPDDIVEPVVASLKRLGRVLAFTIERNLRSWRSNCVTALRFEPCQVSNRYCSDLLGVRRVCCRE